MLVIEGNSVYEIDEECLKKRTVPSECGIDEKLVKETGKKNRKEPEEQQKDG